MPRARAAVRGSSRSLFPGHRVVGLADPAQRAEVTVYLRRRAAVPRQLGETLPPYQRSYLEREHFSEAHGAAPADIAAVRRFARAYGLVVTSVDGARRAVTLAGPVGAMNRAVSVKLALVQDQQGRLFRGRTGAVTVPHSIAQLVTGVYGLDNRRQARPFFQIARGAAMGLRAQAAGGPFTPIQLAQLYDFPTNPTGHGQCIGIVELGGGFRPADLRTYFTNLGIAPASQPNVVAVSVDGGRNQPTGQPGGPDGEVMLDIEVAGAVAPGASIAVYFAPNTERGFIDAVTTAIHDNTHRPSVISISWGAAESRWTAQLRRQMEQAFVDAAAIGVTVL